MEFDLKVRDAQYAVKLLGITAKLNSADFDGQILIKVHDDKVLFISNNGSSGISCEVPAIVTTPGQASLLFSQIKTFFMTFSPWDGDYGVKKFAFKTKDNKLTVYAKIHNESGRITNSRLKLDTQTPSAFLTEVILQEPNLILNSSIIKTAIEKSFYAIDKNSVQDYVRGLRVLVDDSAVKFTATNGAVVSDFTIKGEGPLKDGEYFLSFEFLSGLRRLLTDDTQLFFELQRTKNMLTFDNVVYWSKSAMYREYPEYSRVFELADKSLVLDKNTLLNGVSSIEDVWDSDDHNRLTIELKNNELTLTTDKALFEYGEFEGLPDFVIDVDGKDFLNILRTIADDEVRLKCGDERQGMTVESVGWDDHRTYLVSLVRR